MGTIGRRALLGLMAAGWAGVAGAKPKLAAVAPGDLEGTWTLGSYTEFQRPKELHALVLTPAEAEAYEAPRRALHGTVETKDDKVGQPESEFIERGVGLARVHGQIRSSWIVDPADGKVPYTAAAKARLGVDKEPPAPDNFDNPENLNGATRCLSNGAAGAPMVGALDANLFQIVQTRDHVAILTEKYHETRIVRLGPGGDGGLRPDAGAGAWIGDSVGHWEGATLVVETAGFRPGDTRRGGGLVLSQHSTVVERFTREGPDTLLYQFTVTDPTLLTQAWSAEITLDKAPGRIFEFACHEGNYAMTDILAGARHGEHEAAAGK
jgi:hypothetical protein